MIDFDFSINGNFFLFLLIVLIAGAIALFSYYRTVPPIRRGKKIFLISLRTLAIALLVFALFKPVFSSIKSSMEKPIIAVFYDNSLSAGTEDASFNRKDQVFEVIDKLDFGRTMHENYLFDKSTREIDNFAKDSLSFKGNLTNLTKPLKLTGNLLSTQNINAILLVTDGAFNDGANPLYDAEKLGKPIYTIGIGDSVEPRDLSVKSIITNDVTYLNSILPVNVDVSYAGLESNPVTAILYDNTLPVDTVRFDIESEKGSRSLLFDFKPKEAGTRKISLKLSELDGEISYLNNTSFTYIDVIENKRRIALFAGSPSPDLSFLKKEIIKNEGVELNEFIQREGATFYNEPTRAALQQAEMLILIDFPNRYTPDDAINLIAQRLIDGTPVLFIAGFETDYQKLKSLETHLPFVVSSSTPREYYAAMNIKQDALVSSVLRVEGNDNDANLWNALPPIFRTETFVSAKPESNVLSTVVVNGVELSEPLIISRNFQTRKSLAVLGYGLYRWKLMGYASESKFGATPEYDLYSIFVNNSLRWLSVKSNQKQVLIESTEDNYAEGESVELTAQVYDAAFVPIDNATVTVDLKGDKDTRQIILNSIGNGRYKVIIDGLSPGEYYFTGDARYENNVIGKDDGRFNIGASVTEFQNLTMNAPLLRTLAERTGGNFYLPENADEVINDILSNESFTEKPITTRSEFALWDTPWLLAIALLFFSIEWFVRKRAGMI